MHCYFHKVVNVNYFAFFPTLKEHIASRKKILQEELKLWEGYLAEVIALFITTC